MQRTILLISGALVLGLGTGAVLFAERDQSQEQTKPSTYRSKTPPDALHGNHGTTRSVHYFSWLSDVEQPKALFQYCYLLMNEHQNRTLTARWHAAGMDATRLKGQGKYSYSFQSTCGYQENGKATISFGPVLQHSVLAPVYERRVKAGGDKYGEGDRPLLRSRVFASRITGLKDEDVVDLTFECSIDGGRLTLSVQNLGTIRRLPFAIPSLEWEIEDYTKRKFVNYPSGWPISKRFKYGRSVVFEAPGESPEGRGKPSSLVVQFSSGVCFTESVRSVIILDPQEGEPLTSARVSLYLPEVQ